MNWLRGGVESLAHAVGQPNYHFGDLTRAALQRPTVCEAPVVSHSSACSARTVVIVGGGPVGLWLAVTLRHMSPATHVVVYERHAVYKRTHVVRPGLVEFDPAGLAKQVFGGASALPVLEAERRLLALALDAGVEIAQREVSAADVENWPVLFPPDTEPVALVGADGAHSLVRRTAFSGELAASTDLLYVVELRFKTRRPAEPLPQLRAYALVKACGFLVTEQVHGNSVAVRITVPPDVYATAEGATFRSPWRLDAADVRAKLAPALRRALFMWLNARVEMREKGSEKLSAFKLSAYYSSRFLASLPPNGAGTATPAACLVGDAAFGVPFFRSLTNGLQCASVLAMALASTAPAPALANYAHYVTTLASAEYATASGRHALIASTQTFCSMSAAVPWQVVRLSGSEIRDLSTDPFLDPGNDWTVLADLNSMLVYPDFPD